MAAKSIYEREADSFRASLSQESRESRTSAIRMAASGDREALVALRESRKGKIKKMPGVLSEMLGSTMRFYRPKVGSDFPVLLYLHGGGWTIGGIESCSAFCAALAAKGVAVVALDYRLAPENPFPSALGDVAATFRFLRRHAKKFGCDPRKISIGGDSSGGNLAVAASILLQMDDLTPASLVLYYPVVVAKPDGSRSWADFATGYGLDADFMEACNAAYLEKHDFADPLVSPVLASETQIRRLPPVHLLAADRDILRDQGIKFASRLAHSGVNVRYELLPGSVHLFVTVEGQRHAFARAVDFAREAVLPEKA